MDICEFEYITADLERNIKTLKLLLEIFNNKIEEDYYSAINKENKEYYYEIRAFNDMLNLIKNNFDNIETRYTAHIKSAYTNSLS